jgi:hypothetical protein
MLQQSPNQYARRWPSFSLAVDPRPCRRSQTLVGALVPAVVMSGVVDSGRPRGHGNVDANGPQAAKDIASRIIWLGQS